MPEAAKSIQPPWCPMEIEGSKVVRQFGVYSIVW